MSNHTRLETSDFIFDGEDILSSDSSVSVIDGEKSRVVSKGESTVFFGMDKYIAAFMLKQGVNEVVLTQSDMDKVESFSIDWSDGKSKVTLSANNLPLKEGKNVVPIIVYSPNYPFDNDADKYWDFYTPKLAGKGLVSIFLVPESIVGEDKIAFIDKTLKMHTRLSQNAKLEYKTLNVDKAENNHKKITDRPENRGVINKLLNVLSR